MQANSHRHTFHRPGKPIVLTWRAALKKIECTREKCLARSALVTIDTMANLRRQPSSAWRDGSADPSVFTAARARPPALPVWTLDSPYRRSGDGDKAK